MNTNDSFITVSQVKTFLLTLVTCLLVILGPYAYYTKRSLEQAKKKNVAAKAINHELYQRNRHLVEVVDSLQTLNERQVQWMTRALVSETSRTGKEMRVIATIIRNRAELGWRGNDTIKEVVLDPYQFSAFNPGRSTARLYRNMTAENTPHPRLWEEARQVATQVLAAPRSELPTSLNVLHFVHPGSLERPAPKWVYVLPKVEIEGLK